MVKATSRDRACDSGLSRVKSIFPRRNFSPLPHTEKRANHFKNKTGTSIIESKTFSILFLVFAQSFKGLIWKLWVWTIWTNWTNMPTYLGFRSSVVKDCGFEITARQKEKGIQMCQNTVHKKGIWEPINIQKICTLYFTTSVQLHWYNIKFSKFLVSLSLKYLMLFTPTAFSWGLHEIEEDSRYGSGFCFYFCSCETTTRDEIGRPLLREGIY